MSEYTPTTDAVRKGYSYVPELPKGARHHPPLIAEFDRWLNSVKAEAWDEGADFQFVNSPFPSTLDKGNNPYRTGGEE